MDNAVMKRGIGAVVLAVIAALLLGWLLKDKSSERQEVVDMKLPGAPEMNIPSLMGSDDDASSTATLVNETLQKAGDTASNTGTAVVASATGAVSKLGSTISDTAGSAIGSTKQAIENVTGSAKKPGFAIRPAGNNEAREVVDARTNVASNDIQADKKQENTTADNVVASTKKVATNATKKVFTPTIVKKKKPKVTPVKEKAPKAAETKVAKKTTPSPTMSAAPAGKYSIQLLATSSQSRANKLAKTMKSEGYSTFITQTQKNNKILYRVRVGAHNARTGAIKAQEGMKRRYQKNFFVQNSLVISN